MFTSSLLSTMTYKKCAVKVKTINLANQCHFIPTARRRSKKRIFSYRGRKKKRIELRGPKNFFSASNWSVGPLLARCFVFPKKREEKFIAGVNLSDIARLVRLSCLFSLSLFHSQVLSPLRTRRGKKSFALSRQIELRSSLPSCSSGFFSIGGQKGH